MTLSLLLPGAAHPWNLPGHLTSVEFQIGWTLARTEDKSMTIQVTAPDGLTEVILYPRQCPWYAISES
jgi:hypothetical protein